MNELTSSQYLEAMGIDAYVSRWQAPGASVTQRLALAGGSAAAQGIEPITSLSETLQAVGRQSIAPEGLDSSESRGRRNIAPNKSATEEFSLLVIELGGWVWIEELTDVHRLREHHALLQSLGLALGLLEARAKTSLSATQFDWPMHGNRQLDQGEEAGRASVTGFLRRRVEQSECHGLVVLGTSVEKRVTWEELGDTRALRTVGIADMLRDPMLKPVAWRDLRPHLLKV
ncbi:MAG: hypothetical protein AAGF57_10725 [Pseudomonadota bacterium]